MSPSLILLTSLIERFGLIVGGAFMLLSITPLHKARASRHSWSTTLLYILFFGLFGIMGTYSGDSVLRSVANLRAMAVITGGLFGGPLVGAGAGFIAGLHRNLIDLGGFSSLPCGLATFLEGLGAGLLSARLGRDSLDWKAAGVFTVVGESGHMLLVLALARPLDEAVALVQVIGMPMILVNTLGAVMFTQIINLVFKEREKRESTQAEELLSIASQTVSHLRSGLNPESALATARIMLDRIPVAAISITDTRTVLAHVGLGADHHLALEPIRTQATRKVIATNRPMFFRNRRDIGCDRSGCPLSSAIIVPLVKGGMLLGTLKCYGSQESRLDEVRFQMLKGLADLFSTQLELEDIHVKATLLAQAEIRRLQTQINPHFLFNSLNTIAAFCRTNPARARELILDLSLYMRRNLDSHRDRVPVHEEVEQVMAYLAIEQARFGDRVKVAVHMDADCGDWPVPPLIIQPLVENAVKHGVSRREEGGTVRLFIHRENGNLAVEVADDGVGMSPECLSSLREEREPDGTHCGIGVINCDQRLVRLFGSAHRLRIESAPGKGTHVGFTVPAEGG